MIFHVLLLRHLKRNNLMWLGYDGISAKKFKKEKTKKSSYPKTARVINSLFLHYCLQIIYYIRPIFKFVSNSYLHIANPKWLIVFGNCFFIFVSNTEFGLKNSIKLKSNRIAALYWSGNNQLKSNQVDRSSLHCEFNLSLAFYKNQIRPNNITTSGYG